MEKENSPAIFGDNIKTMQMVREIRDELSGLYWKDPVAYIEETNKIARDFIETLRTTGK